MKVTDEMVSRFLNWRLPDDFAPDAGITFKRAYNERLPFGPSHHEPTGTNLLTAPQARQMLEHVLAELYVSQPQPTEVTDRQLEQLFDAVYEYVEFGREWRERARAILRTTESQS